MDDPGHDYDNGVGAHEHEQRANIKTAQHVLLQQLGQEHGRQREIEQIVVKDLGRIELENAKFASKIAEHDDHKEGGNDPNQLKHAELPSPYAALPAVGTTWNHLRATAIGLRSFSDMRKSAS